MKTFSVVPESIVRGDWKATIEFIKEQHPFTLTEDVRTVLSSQTVSNWMIVNEKMTVLQRLEILVTMYSNGINIQKLQIYS